MYRTEILNKISGEVLHFIENKTEKPTIKKIVEDAVRKGANLGRANLTLLTAYEVKHLQEMLVINEQGKLKMSDWQSDKNWKQCKTSDELHECGTSFCNAGYCHARESLLNPDLIDQDAETVALRFIPNLAYTFRMNDKQFIKEAKRRLEQHKNNQ